MSESRALTRLLSALATLAGRGDDHAWLTVARALQGALEREDPDGSARHALWSDIVEACERTRSNMRSRPGRLEEAQRADVLVGPLLRDALNDPQVDVARVFALAEVARSRVLLDALGGIDRGESGDPREPELATRVVGFAPDRAVGPLLQEEMLISAVRHLEIEQSRTERAAALTELEALYTASGGGFVGSVPTAALSDVQAALGPRQLLVEYVLPYHPLHPAHSLAALVISRDDATVIPLCLPPADETGVLIGRTTADGRRPMDTSPLGLLVILGRRAVQGDDQALARGVARLLHRTFVEPVSAVATAHGRHDWVIVPHRQLHPLPWIALIAATGRPWLAEVSVTVSPSASTWLRLAARPRRGRSALALGDPLLGYAGLRALPAAADEVEHLRAVWKRNGWKVDARTGATATAAAFESEAAAANVVHLATHGSFPTADAGAAHQLFLGIAPRSPGALSLPRIRKLNLEHAWCTTLSICDGGLYLVGPGDEPLGMVAAVLEAGTSTVIAAQWQVDDDAGRRLMRHLVDALGRPGSAAGPAAALREAALALAAEGAPIRHWAAFVAVGDGRGPTDEPEPTGALPGWLVESLQERDAAYGAAGVARDLAAVLDGRGDAAGAREALVSAAAASPAEHAGVAAVELASARWHEDDVEGALKAAEHAVELGHPCSAPRGALLLGLLREQESDLTGAAQAYRLVVGGGDPAGLPLAAHRLGVVLGQLSDGPGAETALRTAVDAGDEEHAPAAALALGILHLQRGDTTGARAAYETAIRSGHPEQAPMASIALAELLVGQGDLAEAAMAYRKAVAAGHARWSGAAAHALGDCLRRQGDREGARAAYAQARLLGHVPEENTPAGGRRRLLARWRRSRPGKAAR